MNSPLLIYSLTVLRQRDMHEGAAHERTVRQAYRDRRNRRLWFRPSGRRVDRAVRCAAAHGALGEASA